MTQINLQSKQPNSSTFSKNEAITSDYRLVDMKYITELTGMTAKWFYSLIKDDRFPKPIKLGRSSRWRAIDVHKWIEKQGS